MIIKQWVLLAAISAIAAAYPLISFFSCSSTSLTPLFLLPQNTLPAHQNTSPKAEAYRTLVYCDRFSSQKVPIVQFLFLLQLHMPFCCFSTITQQIFRTKLAPPYSVMLLHILRNCDILSLPSEVLTIPQHQKKCFIAFPLYAHTILCISDNVNNIFGFS